MSDLQSSPHSPRRPSHRPPTGDAANAPGAVGKDEGTEVQSLPEAPQGEATNDGDGTDAGVDAPPHARVGPAPRKLPDPPHVALAFRAPEGRLSNAPQATSDPVGDDDAEWRSPDGSGAYPAGRDPRFSRFPTGNGRDLTATWRHLDDDDDARPCPLGGDPRFVRGELEIDAPRATAAPSTTTLADRLRRFVGERRSAAQDALRNFPWRVRLWWPTQRRSLAWGGTLLLAARARLLALVRRLGPAELSLYEDAFAHLTTQALHALVGAGVFDALADGAPHSVEALAKRLVLDAAVLRRLLRYGATRGWVRAHRRDRFSLARGGRPLRTDVPAPMAPFVRYAADASSVTAAAAAPEVLRRGGNGFPTAHGVSVWQWLAEHPQTATNFDAAMATLSARDVVHVGRALAKLAPGDVCDLGGGHGALLQAALAAQPGVRGTLVERPEVLVAAKEQLTKANLHDRISLVAGDLFALPPLRARAYVLRNIVHDWNDADVMRILRGVRRSMRAGDQLFLVETLTGARANAVEALSDVAMLLMTDGGQQRDVAALRALAARANLAWVGRTALPLPMQLLQFRPS